MGFPIPFLMLPNGLEPPLLASEASALSIKLRGQLFAKATGLKSVYNNGDNFKSIEHSAKKFKGIAEKLHCAKNEKVNSTHLSPSRFYFCTVDIFSFTPLMVCLNSF